MTDPIKQQKAARWDALVAQGMAPDEATQRVESEFADPFKITGTPRIGSESTGTRATIRNATPEQVAANKQADVDFAKGLTRQAAQGATFGFADEIEAGARSAFGPRDYRTVRDEIRAQDAAFQQANPGTALAANLAGGILTGGALGAAAKGSGAVARTLTATGLAPKVDAGATMGQRVLQAAKTGAVAGGIGGAGMARESTPGDLGSSVALGATVGGTAGGAFGLGAEMFRGARNLLSRVGQGQEPAGPVRRAIRADSPEQSAAKRVLQRASNQGMSLDDVAARSAAADGPDVLGEVLGEKGIRDIRTARGLGYEAPDMIETSLRTRARNDVGNLRRTVRQELGEQIDDKALPQQKLLEAQRAASPLYEEALDGVTITDPRLAEWMQRPAIRQAYGTARRLAANDGVDLPPSAAIIRGAQRAPDAADDVIGTVTRAGGRADAAGDDLANLGVKDLRGARRGGDMATMTDADLNAERMYLAQMQGDDQARAVLVQGPEYQEYLSLREIGALEDARGIMEQMGFVDPNDFAQATRDGQAAAKRLADRAARIRSLEAEMQRRAQDGPARAVAGRGAVSVPEVADAPELPTLTGRQVQYIKHALDDKIAKLEGMRGGTSTKEYAQLVKARTDVDGLLYEFANQGEDGASLWGAANRAYAKPMQEAEAFTEGVRGGRGIQAPDVPRLLEGEQASWRSRGVANTLQDDLARMGDGTTGRIQDPAPALMGSESARARLEVAAGGDLNKVARLENAAGNVSRRLRTRNIVTGNSQTAEKLADMAEQGLNPGELIQGATSPVGLATRALGRGANALARNALGQDMDAMARVLMAGAPGQMTRQEAIASLQRMEPFIRQQLMRQLVTRGAIGGAAGRAAAQPSR